MNESRSQEIAVVGAGIVGLCTAYALVTHGAKVHLYEQGAPGAAQSGGQTRLFRHSHDDPRLVVLARRSRALWHEWSARLGVELVSSDGSVVLGSSAGTILSQLERHHVPARFLSAAELRDRLPALAPYDGPAVLDQSAGAIRAHAAVSTLAARLGPRLIADEVLAIEPTRHGTVEIRSGGGCREFAGVVVCAGANTAQLAQRAGVTIPLTTAVHVRATFGLRLPASSRLACLQDRSEAFSPFGAYGAPLPDGRSYAVGISHASDSEETGLASIVDRTSDYVAAALPGLDPEPVALRHCRVTTLPWGSDGVAVWEHERVFYLAGHNLFKHAPVIGDALARAALGQPLDDELRPAAQLGAAL